MNDIELPVSEQRKTKRQKRINQKEAHIKRQVKIAKAHGLDVKDEHRFAKHNAMDCGVPDCPMCSNPRHNKNVKHKMTRQEIRSIDSMESGLSE